MRRLNFKVNSENSEYDFVIEIDEVYRLRGKANENGVEFVFNVESKHIDALLEKLEAIINERLLSRLSSS